MGVPIEIYRAKIGIFTCCSLSHRRRHLHRAYTQAQDKSTMLLKTAIPLLVWLALLTWITTSTTTHPCSVQCSSLQAGIQVGPYTVTDTVSCRLINTTLTNLPTPSTVLPRAFTELHSKYTVSVLLGNHGSHVYNGNTNGKCSAIMMNTWKQKLLSLETCLKAFQFCCGMCEA